MNEHPTRLLHDFIFQRLGSQERQRVEAHLSICAECARQLVDFQSAVEQVAAEDPRPALRDRLFESIEHLERFAPFAPRLGELMSVSSNEARRALHAFADVDTWPLRPLPGLRALPLSMGAPAPAQAILACFEPTSMVPWHRHVGSESILVFQGAFLASDGQVIRAGDELRSESGSAHGIVQILDGIDCMCAIINSDRIDYEEPPERGTSS